MFTIFSNMWICKDVKKKKKKKKVAVLLTCYYYINLQLTLILLIKKIEILWNVKLWTTATLVLYKKHLY